MLGFLQFDRLLFASRLHMEFRCCFFFWQFRCICIHTYILYCNSLKGLSVTRLHKKDRQTTKKIILEKETKKRMGKKVKYKKKNDIH